MSTCKVEFKGFNIDSSSLNNYLNQFTIDGKQKIEQAKDSILHQLRNAEDNKLGVLKLALNSEKAYIKDLANIMLNTNRKFYAEVEINNNLQGFSKYNANDNKIYINVDAISQRFSENAEEYLYERIVHDFIQGFANKELKKAYTDTNRDSPHMRNIINLFKEYQDIVDKKQYDLFKGSIEKEPMLDPRSERSLVREGFAEGTYRAMTNVAEFLSYGLSNSEFRNTLRKQNLWQKFVSWLKDLLGISQDNNDLEYLYRNLDAYLKTEEETSGNKKTEQQQTGSQEELNIYWSSNENKELSNLALRPFEYEGDVYYSVEHAYQSLKSGIRDDITYINRNWKKGGVKIPGRWKANTTNDYNIKLMKELIKESFLYNVDALEALLKTRGKKLTHKQDTGIWKEMFPKLLMEVRDELWEMYNNTPSETQENYGEEFQIDQFIFSYNPETGKYYQHFKSKKGEVKELTNEKQQNKTFLKYIEKHPEHAEIVTYENTGNKYAYDKQRDKVISLSTGDTIVQNDIVDKVKNHEEYEHKKEVERVKRIIKSNISSLNDIDMLELLHELRNKGYDIKDEVVYFEALLEIREDEKKEIHKKEEPIKKEEIAKEEKPKKEEEPENSFSYKGITIPTKFQLSEEQEQALITLIENVTSGDTEPITLSGFAGTGKTSVIRYLEDYLKQKRGYKFLYGAPTHAATLYLGYNVDRMPFTVASSVIQQRDDTGKIEYVLSGKVTTELDDYSTNIFVVDEASMIDSKTLDNFLKVTSRRGIKVIFMGDKMQLPEVTSGSKVNPETKNSIKDVSKVFTDFNLIQLSNVQRTKDNAILRVLTEIRNNPDGILPVIDNTETLKFYDAGVNNDFYRNFRKTYEQDPEETVYITYTNEDVKNFNKKFREAILGEEADGLEKGEIIVGYLGYGNKSLNKNDVANSIKYTVKDIKRLGSEIELELTSSQINKLNSKHGISGETQTRTTYLQMSEDDAFSMKELTEEDYEKNKKRIADILKGAYLIKKDALDNKNWRGFSSRMKKATDVLAKLEVGNNYFYNPYTDKLERTDSVNWNNPNMAALKKNYKEVFIEKSIDYGYGITIHKSQGATFKNVFFNATSTNFSSIEIHENGMQIGTEGNSLNYVGMSRASEKLHVLHSKNIKRLNNDDSIELSKNCSVF